MNVNITRNINIRNWGMPMGGFCAPMYTPCMPCIPMVGGYYGGIWNNDMAAGYCVGAALSNPGIAHALGSGIKWTFNKVIKPVGKFIWNDIIKPVGKGLKWVWDHTLGWVFKKIGGK